MCYKVFCVVIENKNYFLCVVLCGSVSLDL